MAGTRRRRPSRTRARAAKAAAPRQAKALRKEGWQGWDEYAPFYDWENARTLGRRDVPFWRRVALEAGGPVLELGCGTGRVSLPLVRAGAHLVGIDRSRAMLQRLRKAITVGSSRSPSGPGRTDWSAKGPRPSLHLIRGDIRWLPFEDSSFDAVIAPYGILQSLLADRDLSDALASVARVLKPGGTFGLDLVPDVPNWREYSNRVQLRGRAERGVHLTLVESVRQDRARRLTTFEQRYVARRNAVSTEHRFELTFRTLSVPQMRERLEREGFIVDRVLGDYRGGAWDRRADVWIILVKKR
jgi:ubiquinone/menaquinone biosynthesis C-methylase UbiE